MTQLIDKSTIIAEIDALQDATMENGHFLSSYHEGIFDGLSKIENFLDTFETKEVDEEYNGKAMLHVLEKGVKQGKRETLNKVCEWLLNNVRYYSTNALGAEYMCEDLCKAMSNETE